MPATPAWPPDSLPRLFIDAALEGHGEIVIDGVQANYLVRVLRLKAGAQVKLFDDRTGEWLAELAHIGKRDAVLRIGETQGTRTDAGSLALLRADQEGPYRLARRKGVRARRFTAGAHTHAAHDR